MHICRFRYKLTSGLLQDEASKVHEAQQSSNDYKEYLDTLKDEVVKLNAAVKDTAGFSQELSVRCQ